MCPPLICFKKQLLQYHDRLRERISTTKLLVMVIFLLSLTDNKHGKFKSWDRLSCRVSSATSCVWFDPCISRPHVSFGNILSNKTTWFLRSQVHRCYVSSFVRQNADHNVDCLQHKQLLLPKNQKQKNIKHKVTCILSFIPVFNK